MQLYAKLVHPEWGYPYHKEMAEKLDFGAIYKVSNLEIGQSSSSFDIDGIDRGFNTIQFDFYDENLKKIDIFQLPEFNHYI